MRFFNNDVSCPEVPPLTVPQQQSSMAAIINGMGIKACSTSAERGTSFQLLGPLLQFDTSKPRSTTISCEGVQAISQNYNQAISNVACILKNSSNVVTSTQSGINSIEFKAGGNLIIDCSNKNQTGGLQIDQTMNLKLVQSIQVSEEEIDQIATAVDSTIKDTSQMINESENGFGSTAQGQKLIKEITAQINKQDMKSSIRKTLNDFKTSQQGTNSIKMEAGGDLIIYGNQCTIKQDMVLDMLANNIVNNVYKATFSDLTKAINQSDAKFIDKSKNEGIPDTYDWKKMLIGGIILIVVIIIIVWVIKQYKQAQMTGGMMNIRFSPYSDAISSSIRKGNYTSFLMLLIYIGIIGYALYTLNNKQLRSEHFRYEEGEDLMAGSTSSSQTKGIW